MNLNLKRTQFRPDGIFGEIQTESGEHVAMTLEHSYSNAPKLPEGEYRCVLGMHRLHNMRTDFQAFEIMDVPGHDNILFHWGNYNRDSEGCVLLGEMIAQSAAGQMVTNSRGTFARFMALQGDLKSFTLTVS